MSEVSGIKHLGVESRQEGRGLQDGFAVGAVEAVGVTDGQGAKSQFGGTL